MPYYRPRQSPMELPAGFIGPFFQRLRQLFSWIGAASSQSARTPSLSAHGDASALSAVGTYYGACPLSVRRSKLYNEFASDVNFRPCCYVLLDVKTIDMSIYFLQQVLHDCGVSYRDLQRLASDANANLSARTISNIANGRRVGTPRSRIKIQQALNHYLKARGLKGYSVEQLFAEVPGSSDISIRRAPVKVLCQPLSEQIIEERR